MKRVLLSLAVVALASMALAEPFVWPNAWTAAEPGEAQHGGTFRDWGFSEPRTFNPIVSAEANDVIDNADTLGASLLTRGPDSDVWLPYAAESYEVSEDGTVVDIVLRDGIKWSDGSEVTVDDYMTRYILETDPDMGSNAFDGWHIAGELIVAEKTGENSLRVTFPQPDRLAFFTLAIWRPVPDKIFGEAYREGGVEAVQALWGTNTPISETIWTSPFYPVAYTPGERIVFERNPYFGEWNVDEQGNALPYLDAHTVTIVQDQDSALNLYLAGEVDVFAPRTLDDIGVINVAVQNGDIDAEVLENVSPVATSQFIVFNWNLASNPFKQELFRSADFRRAMSHLIPRDALVELVYGGAAQPMWSNVYQVNSYWVNEDVPKYAYDPEAAAELLAGLGFSRRNANGILVDAEGNELSFNLVTNAGNNQREQIMQIFADSAREVGVDVNIQPLDFNLLVDQLFSTGDDRPFEAILIGLRGGSRDWPFGDNVLNCDGSLHMFNTSGECLTPQETLVENLTTQGRQTLDTEAAREIGFEIQEVLASQQSTIFTVSPTAHFSWLSSIQGEHPPEYINALLGARELPLTYKTVQ